MDNKVVELQCTTHKKSLKFICTQCILLFCTKCNNTHLQQYRDHTCHHIDDIRQSLSTIHTNSNISDIITNKSNNPGCTQYSNEIEEIWNFIKCSSNTLKSLESKESEISDHFRKLHEYLIVEEHRLKKPIFTNSDLIRDQINQQINVLKSFVNIIEINNTTPPTLSTSTSSSSDIILPDTTEQYSISNIVSLIQQSESLQQFIVNNSNTLFYQQDNQHIKENLNNSPDLIILELLKRHSTEFNKYSIKSYAKIDDVNISISSINNNLIQHFKKIITSIKLQQHTVFKHEMDPEYQNTLILSTHSEGKGASLIDIADPDNITIKDTTFPYNNWTFNSFVKIGQHIYVFGGFDKNDLQKGNETYGKYSIVDQKFEFIGQITNILGADYISVSYDGDEYIYLIGGYNQNKRQYHRRIDRYNIKTDTFENFTKSEFPNVAIISFFLNGQLYAVSRDDDKLYQLDIQTQIIKIHSIGAHIVKSMSACTDGNGIVYLCSDFGIFSKLNVVTKQVEMLREVQTSFQSYGLSMIYTHHYIYLFGGDVYGNFQYNIADNQWKKLDVEDKYSRRYCGSILLN